MWWCCCSPESSSSAWIAGVINGVTNSPVDLQLAVIFKLRYLNLSANGSEPPRSQSEKTKSCSWLTIIDARDSEIRDFTWFDSLNWCPWFCNSRNHLNFPDQSLFSSAIWINRQDHHEIFEHQPAAFAWPAYPPTCWRFRFVNGGGRAHAGLRWHKLWRPLSHLGRR